MTHRQKQILFISHDASRTGAPIALLRFLRLFKQNTNIPFQILLKRGGELACEFSKLAPTHMLNYSELCCTRDNKALYRILRKLGLSQSKAYSILRLLGFKDYLDQAEFLRKIYANSNIQLIYSNTITNGDVLEALTSFLNCPIISHAHELQYGIESSGLENFKKTKKLTTYYITCAQAVKDNLEKLHSIPSKKMSVIYEFTDIAYHNYELNILHKELHLSDHSFVVGASCTIDWRKGADLFIYLAFIIHKRSPSLPIHFVWIGAESDFTVRQMNLGLDRLPIRNHIHFIGAKADPMPYFNYFDLFVLTSREDPFPHLYRIFHSCSAEVFRRAPIFVTPLQRT